MDVRVGEDDSRATCVFNGEFCFAVLSGYPTCQVRVLWISIRFFAFTLYESDRRGIEKMNTYR